MARNGKILLRNVITMKLNKILIVIAKSVIIYNNCLIILEDFMHISHKGYTLAETLVTILIIGVLSAVTLPILQKAAGNKLETMRIKCMYILEQTVSQMLADDVMYPQSNSSPSIGLANTKEITFNGVKYEGNTKFCELFASRINKMHNSVTN